MKAREYSIQHKFELSRISKQPEEQDIHRQTLPVEQERIRKHERFE
jgi:hypothetical protein